MADKDKKKLKVILKLPKSSAQLKSPATAAAVPNSSAHAFPAARASQFASVSDQRDKNVQVRQLAATSSGSLPRITGPTSSLVRFNASGSAPSAPAAAELRGVSLPSSDAPTPPKKRKFKSVENAGAPRLAGSVLGASTAVDASGSSKGVLKDGVKVQADEKASAVIEGRGAGAEAEAGRVGGATGARDSEASAQRKSLKKAEKSGVQSDGRQGRDFAGVDLQSLDSSESVLKPMLEVVVDKLQKKDTYSVFAEPVDAAQVPDYYDIIKDPMDFGTMRKKIKKGSYATIELFEADINLICNNAMRYNGPETIYFKQAKAIRDLARKALDGVRAQLSGDVRRSVPNKKRLPPPTKKLHSKKPGAIKARLDGSIVDFSSGAILSSSGGNRDWSKSTVDISDAEKGLSSADVGPNEFASRSTAPSTGTESKPVTREDASGSTAKSMGPKDGRRPLSTEEYHRNTYKQRNLPAHGQGPPLAAVGGELRQLIPVTNGDEHAYAQSVAQFGALLGQKAWCIVAKKLLSIQAASITADTTPSLTSDSPVLGGIEKEAMAPRPPVASMDNILPHPAAKLLGRDARNFSLSGHSQPSQSMAVVNLASGFSRDVRGRVGSSEVGLFLSTSNALPTGIANVATGNSPTLSRASPKHGFLEISKRGRRPLESTSGSTIHSSGTRECRGEDDSFAMDEVESGGPLRNQVSDSHQQVVGLGRGFVGSAERGFSLQNDVKEQASAERSGWTQNSSVNTGGCDDRSGLAKGGGKGSASGHAVVGGIFNVGGKGRRSEVLLTDGNMSLGRGGRTQPGTVNAQDNLGALTVVTGDMPSTTDGNLVASGESSSVSGLGWETCSALASSASFVKSHTPTWSTAALLHCPLSSSGQDDRNAQSWGQPRGMTVTHQAAINRNLSTGVQDFHPQSLKLSANVSPVFPPSNVYAEYGNIVSRFESQHGLSAPMSGTSVTQSQDPQSADSFDKSVGSLQKVGANSETNPSTRLAVHRPLQLQSMPPDLNVTLLSPSALPSSPALDGSNPSSSHQPDLKLQL